MQIKILIISIWPVIVFKYTHRSSNKEDYLLACRAITSGLDELWNDGPTSGLYSFLFNI